MRFHCGWLMSALIGATLAAGCGSQDDTAAKKTITPGGSNKKDPTQVMGGKDNPKPGAALPPLPNKGQ